VLFDSASALFYAFFSDAVGIDEEDARDWPGPEPSRALLPHPQDLLRRRFGGPRGNRRKKVAQHGRESELFLFVFVFLKYILFIFFFSFV
jgi:hypothetical protein